MAAHPGGLLLLHWGDGMRDATARRLQLKSKLLVGAAGMAAAAASTAAMAADSAASSSPPSDPPKWLPYVDIGGGLGSGYTAGHVEAFVPVVQDLDSLFFVRIGDEPRTNYDNNFNIGAGYRTKIDQDWILGVFGGFDSTQSNNDHTFNQWSLGAEAMSADWDVRANGYFAKNTIRGINNAFELYIHDTTIAILQAQEAALSGFDGEVGYRVFNTDSTDVRVFAGGYSFSHDNVKTGLPGNSFDYKDLDGWKARAEVNIFDLDGLGAQSRLMINGEISHDGVNHTSEFIGATLRIPLGDASGPGAQTLDDLDRRMVDDVRRNDNVLTQSRFNKPEPVIIYNGSITSQPTNTLYYVEQRAGAGAGTYADPTTIQDATSRGPKNQFIVLTDKGGSTINATGTTVQNGETVTGAGTFKVRGVSFGPVFTHDFAPGSGPTTLTTTGAHGITLGSDTNLYGFTIASGSTDAIYGHNINDVHISHITVDGGANGIYIIQDSGTGSVNISDTSITGVTGDGIDVAVNSTGGTTDFNLNVTRTTIDAGNNGVYVQSTASGGGTVNAYAGIHDSTITAGNIGAIMVGTSSGGATVNQNLVVDPTTITAGDYGIYVTGYADGGSLSQTIGISDVTINGAPDVGVYIGAYAEHGGSVSQHISMTNVSANAAFDGVDFSVAGYDHASVLQYATLTNVTASGADAALALDAFADPDLFVSQGADA